MIPNAAAQMKNHMAIFVLYAFIISPWWYLCKHYKYLSYFFLISQNMWKLLAIHF